MPETSTKLLDHLEKRKYHSAIFTSYSIDLFFLDDFVRQLRHNHISNILVLADSTMLNECLGNLSEGSGCGKSFSLTGYPSRGAFHPKIGFFAGDKDLALWVGSGNLTLPGIGHSNLEGFSFYHSWDENRTAELLIQQAWKYLNELLAPLNGPPKKQLQWINEHSELKKLKSSDDNWVDFENKSVKWIANDKDGGTFSKIIEAIGDDTIEEIIFIAPYYDIDGRSLQLFRNTFNPSNMSLVLNRNAGRPPVNLKDDSIKVYDIRHVMQYKSEKFLHAKMILFKGSLNHYLYCGSANISENALGTRNTLPLNEEAGILLRENLIDIGEYLGLYFLEQALTLKDIKVEFDEDEDGSHEPKPYFIRMAEVSSTELKVTLNKEFIGDGILEVYSNDGRHQLSFELKKGQLIQVCDISGFTADKFNYAVISKDGVHLSNKQVIQHETDINRGHPSKASRAIFAAEGRILENEFVSTEVLDVLEKIYDKRLGDASGNKFYKKPAEGKEKEDESLKKYTYQEIVQAPQHIDENTTTTSHWGRMTILSAMVKTFELAEDTELEDEQLMGDSGNAGGYSGEPGNGEPELQKIGQSALERAKKQLEKIWSSIEERNVQVQLKGLNSFDEMVEHVQLSSIAFMQLFFCAFTPLKITFKENELEGTIYPISGAPNKYDNFHSIFLLVSNYFHNGLRSYLQFRDGFSDEKLTSILSANIRHFNWGSLFLMQRDQRFLDDDLSELFVNMGFALKGTINEIIFEEISEVYKKRYPELESLKFSDDDTHYKKAQALIKRDPSIFRVFPAGEWYQPDGYSMKRIKDVIPPGDYKNAKCIVFEKPVIVEHTLSSLSEYDEMNIYHLAGKRFMKGSKSGQTKTEGLPG